MPDLVLEVCCARMGCMFCTSDRMDTRGWLGVRVQLGWMKLGGGGV